MRKVLDLILGSARRFSEEFHVHLLCVEAVIAVIVLTFEFVEPNPSIREALIVTKISLLCLLVVILIGHLWWAIRQREYAINFPVPATSIIEALSTLGSSPHRILRNDLKRDEIQSFIDLHNEIFKSSKYPEDSVKYYEPSQISEAIIGWHNANEGSLGLVLSLARPIEGEAVSAEGEAVFSRRGSRFCADKSSCWGTSCVLPLTAKGADRYISENISAYDLNGEDLCRAVNSNYFLFVSLGMLKNVVETDPLLLLKAADFIRICRT